jgi:hypothetical protein
MAASSASSKTTAGETAERVDEVIRDEPLRRLARSRSNEKVAVLVEVAPAVPPPEIRLAPGRDGTSGRPDAITVVEPGEDGEPPVDAERVIAGILGHTPVYLRAAGAFACDLDGAQLAELTRSSAIASIRPNRRVAG